MSRIVRIVASSLFLSIAALPAVAFADDNKAPTAKSESGEASPHHGKGKKNKDHSDKKFPIKADAFKQLVEQRIAKAREHLDKALDKHQVPDAMRAQIKKDFDAGATAVRAAASRVSADGEVTKTEAKEVRDLAKDLKQKAREKYGLGRGEHGRRPKKDA